MEVIDPQLKKIFDEEPLPVLQLVRLIDLVRAELENLDPIQTVTRGMLYVNVISAVRSLANAYAAMRDSRVDGSTTIH